MYMYFFDIDDTICNTKEIIDNFAISNNINQKEVDKDWFYKVAGDHLKNYGLHNIAPLKNSTFMLLEELIKSKKEDVYYITARTSEVREDSIKWLKKNNLWLGDNKLIMDTEGIKGKTINNMMQNTNKKFALLFDDLEDNHKEASQYKNIISCLPY